MNSTPTNTARTQFYSNHISSREHEWLKSCKVQDCTFLCPLKQLSSTCHVSLAFVCFFSHLSTDLIDTHNTSGARFRLGRSTPSEPSFSRGGAMLRQPCRHHFKVTRTRSPCEYWHLPECHFYRTETGCKAGDKCLFPHLKVDGQPNKKPKKDYLSPKRMESDDKNAVAILKTVLQLGCVSQDSDALVSQRRFTQSTLRQASIREKKGPSLGKFEDRSHEEIWKTTAMCPKQGIEPCHKNRYMLKENDQAAFYLLAEKWVVPAATKEPEER